MRFSAYTMEYRGDPVSESLRPRHYKAADHREYKRIYEDCFHKMRSSLGLPRECCKSSDELLKNRENIFILEENGAIIGSVAVFDNEIDDLFVAKEHQRRGIGMRLLRFAVALLQQRNSERIILHAADVNKGAVSMYLNCGFVITDKEEIIR